MGSKMPSLPRSLVLKTGRCLLGFPEHTIAPEILAHVTSDRFPKQLPWATANTLESVTNRLTRIHEKWDEGSSYCFAASGKLGANHLGLVTISKTEPRIWAIAYMIAPSEWGRGYATECARCVLDFAFESLSARRVWAGATEWNEASLRIAEKLGMRHFRSNPHSYQVEGRWIPTEDYEITADEWSPIG
jgi:RimJ/RimL family protein N-acetyltransferase